jgi:methionyl-tRNA synthetase
VVWGLVWKGFALYRAGKQAQPGWFVALFLINTLGILEILYLAFFSKRRQRPRRRRG